MDREIKFKAYDEKSKKIRKVNSFAFCENTGRLTVVCMWGKEIIHDKDIIIQRDSKDVELLQFTGLKDVNGVEIYEGDIVKTKYDSTDEIRYCKELMSYIGVPTEPEFREGFNNGNISLGDCHDINLDFKNSKVIGNIYQEKYKRLRGG